MGKGPLHALFQHIHQLDRAAGPRPEWPVVRAENRAKRVVLQSGRLGCVPSRPRHRKDLLQVKRLARIDDVEDAVGSKRTGPIAHGREVARRIEVAAVRLLHDHRRDLAVLVFEFLQENALRAVGLHQQALGSQILDHAGQVVVVRALAPHVFGFETDP